MAQTIANVLYTNMEQVRKKLPELYEMESTAYSLMSKNAEKFRIAPTPNSADFRCPISPAGPASFGTMSLAGGSLGTGGGYTTAQFVQTYFPLSLAVDVDYSAMVGTSGGSEVSAVNAWKQNLKLAIPSFQRMADASFHNAGGNDGLLATSTAVSTATYTMETGFAANLIQVNQPVEIIDTAGSTWKTSAVSPDSLPYFSVVDKANGTATLAGYGTIALATGDKFYFKGAVSAGPAVSWLNGLYYFHTTSSASTMLGLTKTSYDIMPNLVNAAGALVPAHIWQGLAKVRQRRGNIPKGYKGLIHDAQAAAIRNLGLSVTEIQMPAGGAFKTADLAGDATANELQFGGVKHLIDIHQSKTRIDWVLPSDNWCRVYGQELDFYKSPEGKMIFEGRNSSGTVIARFSFFLTTQENYVCVDPGRELVIYGLSIPSGM